MNNKFIIRNLDPTDYERGYLELLSQLTSTPTIGYIQFTDFVTRLNSEHQIIVIQDISTNTIVGTGTILIESKLIHGLGKVAHIEDIVTNSNFRGRGLGALLINHLVQQAQQAGCYKVILDCGEHNIGFYSKCGFEQKGVQMAKYFL